MNSKPISPAGCEWDELKREIFTPEEIAAGVLRVAIISELIKARKDNGITQKELEAASGVKQPVIARMERGTTDPQLSTVMRVLASLGKTLAVVPLESEKHQALLFRRDQGTAT